MEKRILKNREKTGRMDTNYGGRWLTIFSRLHCLCQSMHWASWGWTVLSPVESWALGLLQVTRLVTPWALCFFLQEKKRLDKLMKLWGLATFKPGIQQLVLYLNATSTAHSTCNVGQNPELSCKRLGKRMLRILIQGSTEPLLALGSFEALWYPKCFSVFHVKGFCNSYNKIMNVNP